MPTSGASRCRGCSGVENGPELTDDNLMIPPSAHGVRLLSMGFFVPEDQAVIWRGPMLHKALEQFLTDVAWGEPDYLVIDMPPGTGDVSLSMSQFLPRAEVVIVTTPQPAAQAVAAARRGDGGEGRARRHRRRREHELVPGRRRHGLRDLRRRRRRGAGRASSTCRCSVASRWCPRSARVGTPAHRSSSRTRSRRPRRRSSPSPSRSTRSSRRRSTAPSCRSTEPPPAALPTMRRFASSTDPGSRARPGACVRNWHRVVAVDRRSGRARRRPGRPRADRHRGHPLDCSELALRRGRRAGHAAGRVRPQQLQAHSLRDPAMLDSPHHLCGQKGAAVDLAWGITRAGPTCASRCSTRASSGATPARCATSPTARTSTGVRSAPPCARRRRRLQRRRPLLDRRLRRRSPTATATGSPTPRT